MNVNSLPEKKTRTIIVGRSNGTAKKESLDNLVWRVRRERVWRVRRKKVRREEAERDDRAK